VPTVELLSIPAKETGNEGFAKQHPISFIGGSIRRAEAGRGFRLGGARTRANWEKLPEVTPWANTVIADIEAERRESITVDAKAVSMVDTGELVVNGATYGLEEPALLGLVSRLGYGGSEYLAKCPATLRAHNVNTWRTHLPKDKTIVLRTRASDTGRNVWATVGNRYTEVDVDVVTRAILDAAGSAGYRVDSTYDGARFQANLLAHTTVEPKNMVKGETFRAGIRVRTSDDGSGSVRISSIVFQALCTNLAIVSKSESRKASVWHVGDATELVRQIREALAAAVLDVAPYVERWNVAADEDVVARTAADGTKLPATEGDTLRGYFTALVKTNAVKAPGSKSLAVDGLLAAHALDDSSAVQTHKISRASIVNAITRWAQTLEDPWAQDQVERDAGILLASLRPIPWTEPELVKVKANGAAL
jgi:hypothetical protein